MNILNNRYQFINQATKRDRPTLKSINLKKYNKKRNQTRSSKRLIRKRKSRSQIPKKTSIKCLILKNKWEEESIKKMSQTISKNIRIDPWQKFNSQNIFNSSNFSDKNILLQMGLYIPNLHKKNAEERKNKEWEEYKKRETVIKEKLLIQKIKNIALRVRKNNHNEGNEIQIQNFKNKFPGLKTSKFRRKIKTAMKYAQSAIDNPGTKFNKTCYTADHEKKSIRTERKRPRIFERKEAISRAKSVRRQIKQPQIHLSLRVSKENARQKNYPAFSFACDREESTASGSNDMQGFTSRKELKYQNKTKYSEIEETNTNLNKSQFENNLSLISYGLQNHVFKKTRKLMSTSKKPKRFGSSKRKMKKLIRTEKKSFKNSDDKRSVIIRNNVKNLFFARFKGKLNGKKRKRKLKGKNPDIDTSFRSWDVEASNSHGFVSFDYESPQVKKKIS